MIRYFVIGITVLLTGMIAWILGTTVARATTLESELTSSKADLEVLQDELEQTKRRAEYLNKDNMRLTNLLEQSESDTKSSEEYVEVALTEDQEVIPPEDESSLADTEPQRDQSRWENRRREFGVEMENRRNQWVEYMDERWETSDPETRERISALTEHQNTLLDIRDQMRNADTDDERQQLRESMGGTFQSMRQITMEQQNSMLSQVASEYGISSQDDQTAFNQAVQDVVSDPLFQLGSPGRGVFPGGRGGFGGGRR